MDANIEVPARANLLFLTGNKACPAVYHEREHDAFCQAPIGRSPVHIAKTRKSRISRSHNGSIYATTAIADMPEV